MARTTLTQRVADLERQVSELLAARAAPDRDWRRLVGMFAGDDGMRQVFEEALKLREADRRAARKARRRGIGAGDLTNRSPRDSSRHGSPLGAYGDAVGATIRSGSSDAARLRPGFCRPDYRAEEQCRGWLAKIRQAQGALEEVWAYEQLQKVFAFLGTARVEPFGRDAAIRFGRLRKEKIRVGSQDLRIAAIALAAGSLLLSANLRDFRLVPGLRVENWLDV